MFKNFNFKNSFQISNLKFKIILLVIALLFFSVTPQVQALTMKGTNYIVEMGNENSGSSKPSGTNYKLGITLGQTAPGLFSGSNYKVRSGFQYIHSIIAFSFSISNTNIDFGTLSPTNPVTRTSTLTISNGSANGYQVTAAENHQLLNPGNGQVIPDTTCDSGLCTSSTSDAWTSTLVYGFGYRCDNVTGTDCATGFSSGTNYKQFVASPSAVAVMTGANVGRNKKVTITYKVNISATQPAGLYSNVITYIATPTF